MKKIISLLLIICMILTLLSGCKNNGEDLSDPVVVPNISDQKEGTLKLAYSKADMLDPFTSSTSANLQIMGLIYDGLYKLDKSYEPIPVIAKNAIVGGTTVNVTLSSAVFSDGSPITANDVVYSFEQARFSPAYSTKLINFAQANAATSNMVVFNLDVPDPYALACLTFPIVKSGSVGELPTGTGRYIPEKSGESIYLMVNPKKTDFNPSIKTIMLVPVRDSSAIESSLEIGNTGFYYNDLSDGKYLRINAKTVDMGINNFIFLGFNCDSVIFSNELVRQAVNLAINRNEIVSTAFQGHAREAYSPFNPDWFALASKDLIVPRDTQRAAALLEQSEVDIGSEKISLLVNKDNQFKLETANSVKESLESLGFEVNLKDYEAEYYKEAVEIGAYDIYIGEIRLSPNMDLSALLAGGEVDYGISLENEACIRYLQFVNGGCELMDFINTFNEHLPFAPICYRNAAASYTNAMNSDFNCCDADVFYDIETWSFK